MGGGECVLWEHILLMWGQLKLQGLNADIAKFAFRRLYLISSDNDNILEQWSIIDNDQTKQNI